MIELREKQICKLLEKYTRIRYNHLKRVVVEEKKLMSERTFRETLKQIVVKKLVKKIKIEKQHVEYTVHFDDIKYEKETGDFFKILISNHNKTLERFIDKREKMSKIEQANPTRPNAGATPWPKPPTPLPRLMGETGLAS